MNKFLFFLLLSTHLSFADNCPTELNGNTNLRVWADTLTKWRETLVKKVLEGKQAEVLMEIDGCFPKDSVPVCFGDLKYYADKVQYPGIHSGYVENDLANLTISSLSDLPSEIVNKTDNTVELPENIIELAKKNGWGAQLYKTRSSGGFDGGNNLFILTIPGEKIDMVLQISPKADKTAADNPKPEVDKDFAHTSQDTLTLITLDKTKKPAEGQMRKLYRSGSTKGYPWDNELPSAWRCTECHTGPFKSISPMGYKEINHEKKLSDKDQESIDGINAFLEQPSKWGKREIDGHEIRLGPALEYQPFGWAPENSETRQEEYIKKCASSSKSIEHHDISSTYNVTKVLSPNPQINYTKVAEAMNCVQCHNDKSRGKLHENFSVTEIKFKILIDRSMPRGESLNDDERIALYNCLMHEKYDVEDRWKKSGEWMKGRSCFGTQFKDNILPTLKNNNYKAIEESTPAAQKQ